MKEFKLLVTILLWVVLLVYVTRGFVNVPVHHYGDIEYYDNECYVVDANVLLCNFVST